MLVVAGTGGRHLGRRLAKSLRAEFSELEVEKFPDGELRVRFRKPVKGKVLVILQSFFGDINDKIIETLLAAHTARELKAEQLLLLAPYFPYLREDKRFEPGEAVSAKILAKIFDIFDFVLILDPHLHRFRTLDEFFPNAVRISAVEKLAEFVRRVSNPVIIGPDEESFQWAEAVAEKLGKRAMILKKKRLSPEEVRIRAGGLEVKGRNVVIIDDMISTGRTMEEVAKVAKELGAKKIFCIAVHGIFVKRALERLKRYGEVASTNSIPSPAAKIDILPVLSKGIRELKWQKQKIMAARKALEFVKPGMTLGLGSGSTMREFVKLLGLSGIKVRAVPSSEEIKRVARAWGIRLVNSRKIDLAIDGADQVDSQKRLLKGLGAFAFVEEKKIDYRAEKCIILVDERKLVKRLDGAVLVKVKTERAKAELQKLGRIFREKDGIVFLKLRLDKPEELEKRINRIPGVVDNGIFANFKQKPIIIIGRERKAEIW